MIPEDLITKLLIIDRLIKNGEYVLRDLAWDIGVSPRHVEAVVNNLSNNYLLEVSRGKIIWLPSDNPSTIKPWGWHIVHRSLLGSTQEAARGKNPWSIIVAEYMYLGRGRHGKKWVSGLGGLWLTFKLTTNPVAASMSPIIVPVILARILRNSYGVEAYIKWPNDIIVENKKIAGILIEAEAFREQIILYIGIGINVNNDPPIEETTSLKTVLGRLTPRNKLLSMIIGWMSRLEKMAYEPDKVRKQYIEYLLTLNRKIRAKTAEGIIEGVARDIRDTGELVVETVDGGKKILDPTVTYELRHTD